MGLNKGHIVHAYTSLHLGCSVVVRPRIAGYRIASPIVQVSIAQHEQLPL